MNNPNVSSIINITIDKKIVSWKMQDQATSKQINTGLKNLVYPQFAAELAAESVLKEIGILQRNSKLLKIDNNHWDLVILSDKSVKKMDNIQDKSAYSLLEAEYYDFYRFSALVKDIIIVPNKMSIPYDIEMEIIYQSYMSLPELLDDQLTPYENQEIHIKNDFKLREQLSNADESVKKHH